MQQFQAFKNFMMTRNENHIDNNSAWYLVLSFQSTSI